MNLGVFTIRASTNNEVDPQFDQECEAFLETVSQGMPDALFTADEETFLQQPIDVIFVASDGSEQRFAEMVDRFEGPYYLLTRQSHNSLAAAMEILSFLTEKGLKSEILHDGDPAALGKKLTQLLKIQSVKVRLKHFRLGTTGESSWLIASKVKPDTLMASTGMTMVEIPFDEMMEEIEQYRNEDNEFTQELKRSGYNSEELERALGVHWFRWLCWGN